jgi:acetylornithine deacetylase/succinyl-diaminopimelate desuccinylase-like protein
MSKKIVMYIVMSIVASIVTTVGSFTFKDKSRGPEKITLVVQHPDDCFLLEPTPMSAGMGMGANIVNVVPGKNTFKFDCNGKPVTVVKDVKPEEHIWSVNPNASE